MPVAAKPRKGRGAISNRSSRFDAETRETFDDGWCSEDPTPPRVVTQLQVDRSRRLNCEDFTPAQGVQLNLL